MCTSVAVVAQQSAAQKVRKGPGKSSSNPVCVLAWMQGRGRPKKAAPAPVVAAVKKSAGKRGRPKKVVPEEDSDE